jgi:guanylate kinase
VSSTAGKLMIVSGPSGAGKSTVVHRVLQRFGDRIRLSVSATTRSPRPGEVDGKHYHFLSTEEFSRRHAAGEFLECMEVFGRGQWYGTLLSEVTPSLESGKWVLLEIDVDGADQALEKFPGALTIFIRPSSEAELERRLRGRATEQEEAIQRRLEVARRELERAQRYQFQVVNDTIDDAVDQVCNILMARGLHTA